jgi:AraC-like DNA-binding protein
MAYNYSTIDDDKLQALDHYFILYREKEEGDRLDLIIPDCTPGIMYVEEGSFTRKTVDAAFQIESGKVYLFGQKTKAVEYQFNNERLNAFGFKLRPDAIARQFNLKADEITDTVFDVETLGFSNDELIHSLKNNTLGFSAHQCLESEKLVEKILIHIHENKGQLQIKDLSIVFNVHYKKIQRLFKYYVGIPPKTYARIVRFNNSLKTSEFYCENLTDVAYQSGFFDQNHFIKEVKSFTGKLPSEIFKKGDGGIESNHLNYLRSRMY